VNRVPEHLLWCCLKHDLCYFHFYFTVNVVMKLYIDHDVTWIIICAILKELKCAVKMLKIEILTI
jgi:hypothetical protein